MGTEIVAASSISDSRSARRRARDPFETAVIKTRSTTAGMRLRDVWLVSRRAVEAYSMSPASSSERTSVRPGAPQCQWMRCRNSVRKRSSDNVSR